MSQITSPVILDSTGVRIAAAIEALAGGGGGGGAAGCVTDLGGEIGDGINIAAEVLQDPDESVFSIAFSLQNGLLYVECGISNPGPDTSHGTEEPKTYKLLTFPNIVISEDYEETSFPPFLPDPWGPTSTILEDYLNSDSNANGKGRFIFAQDSNNNNVWTLSFVYSSWQAVSDSVTFRGIMDLHYSIPVTSTWEF